MCFVMLRSSETVFSGRMSLLGIVTVLTFESNTFEVLSMFGTR